MFARPRFALIPPAGPDDTLTAMAHAMGCATMVDAPRPPVPVMARPMPPQAGAPAARRLPAPLRGLR